MGESGLGKTTAIKCLLHSLRTDPEPPPPADDERIERTLRIEPSEAIRLRTDDERLVLELRITDTPGYGDLDGGIDMDVSKIKEYVESGYQEIYEAKEMYPRVNEDSHESLVTCCLYFIAPHRMKESFDVKFIREMSKTLPIIPIIAKADTMTVEEARAFRGEVREKLHAEDIQIYDFGADIAGRENLPPFTIIADRNMECRQYPWGRAELMNPEHSDFVLLKDLLLKKHLQVKQVACLSVSVLAFGFHPDRSCSAENAFAILRSLHHISSSQDTS